MMRVRLPILGFLAGCVLLGCGSSPPTQYYALNEIAPALPLTGAASQVVVRLDPVSIPPELDRLELIHHSAPNRVRIADSQLWAAPLQDQIRRILSDDLAARLPSQLVADPNEPANNEPRRLLSLAIAQFDVDESCAVKLRADWSLRSPGAGARRGFEVIQVAGGQLCGDAIAAAMSHALAELADRLASVIAAIPDSAEPAS